MKLTHNKNSKNQRDKSRSGVRLFSTGFFLTALLAAFISTASFSGNFPDSFYSFSNPFANRFAELFSAKTVLADTVDELQQKIDERNKNIEQINKEIQTYSDLTDKTSQQALSLQKVIKTLEQNAKAMDLDIKKLKEKIEVANLDIKKLDINIGASKDKISSLQESIAASIQGIHRAEDFSFIESVLGQKNLTDFLTEVDSQLSFNNALQTRIISIRDEKQKLENNKNTQETKKDDLVKMQAELANKKKVVESDKAEQSQVLKDTKNQESAFQTILKSKMAQKASFEKEVFDFESQIKYTLDPSSIPKANNSLLAWPLDKVIITQRFGKTEGASRLYVSGSHNGVDFGAKIGTRVLSAGNGTVLGVGDTDIACKGVSFGRWVFIQYDNGLSSIYGHLSVIGASEGQKVKTGDVVGYSGNTGYSTGPHVHLSVYASNAVSVQNRPSISCKGKILRMPIAPIEAYLDPMVYLPAYGN
jgi:murein DD-endopeptidase MepM/ murein hydrolase activator NlpD